MTVPHTVEESDEELTDDEIFIKRHNIYELEEVKRCNIGLKKGSLGDKN